MRTVAHPTLPPSAGDLPPVDVLVATYNSAGTLAESLGAARRFLPLHCLIVVDRDSTDGTPEIARGFGARVYRDTSGLGYARNKALAESDTDPVVFLDSDVRIVRPDYYRHARREYERAGTAAVVGVAVGHVFRYGLPLGLTLIDRSLSLAAAIPDRAQGRETYYLQREIRRTRRSVRYVGDAMVHRGTYRAAPHWPEFQGAAIRAASGWNPREIAYAGIVTLLMHLNSRRPRNIAYSPIFFGKILRGFLAPSRWARLVREPTELTAASPDPGLPP